MAGPVGREVVHATRSADRRSTHIDAPPAVWRPFFLLATSAADRDVCAATRRAASGCSTAAPSRSATARATAGSTACRNILANPRVGLLFLVPGVGDTLRVNGTARIVAAADYLPEMARGGVVPHLAVEVVGGGAVPALQQGVRPVALWD